MKRNRIQKIFLASFLCAGLIISSHNHAVAQGMHYSQFYNAPLLVNPANTALVPDADYRIGVNYRNQWASVPVPYKTFCAFADFSVFRNKFESNWLGVGLAAYNDRAGVGNLNLTKVDLALAYHVQMGETAMISIGATAGYGMRSVDMSKFTYNTQWDGFTFNSDLPSSEVSGMQRANYLDVGAGFNLALFPSENFYLKLGGALAHINQPEEKFLNGSNKMGMRPSANIDLLIKTSDYFIINPSAYYTSQKDAQQIVAGLMCSYLISNTEEQAMLYLGGYYRMNEAAIAMFGFGFNNTRLMVSYDVTMSKLNTYNNKQGALEIGLNYQGFYGEGGKSRITYNCPRF